MTRQLLDPLLRLGLTKNQALLYVATLEQGLITATELSRRTKINRQQVYADTERLIELGLLDITKKKQRKFIAATPASLASLAEKQQAEAARTTETVKQHLPFFESIRPSGGTQANISYFEGLGRIRDAYLKELNACHNTEVLSFVGSVDDLYKFFPEDFWTKWNKRFVSQKNKSKMLVHESLTARETTKNDSLYARETRFLMSFPLKVNIDIFGNTVLVVSVYDELAMWIDSQIMADSYRILFQTCWQNAQSF